MIFFLFILANLGPFAALIVESRRQLMVYDYSNRLVNYKSALKWQETLLAEQLKRRDHPTQCIGSILLLQHEPVYTLGSSTTETCGPFKTSSTSLPFEIFPVERGGKITYHGPGQLVVYPIIDLDFFEKDINFYLRSVEEVIINALTKHHLPAITIPGLTGVWINEHKVAAIGVKISRWVTMHGFSVNVQPNMKYFENIVPCGIEDKRVGNINQFLDAEENDSLSMGDITKDILESFSRTFNVECVPSDTQLL